MRKRNFIIAGIVILVLLCGVFVFFLFSGKRENRDALSCDEPHKDLGRMPVVNGRALGRCVYKIRNSTNRDIAIYEVKADCGCVQLEELTKIPANGTAELKATMTFSAGDINSHSYEIIASPADTTISPISLRISGRGDFSSYFSRDKIDFGACFQGKPKEAIIEVFLLSRNRHQNILRSIEFSNPQLFRFDIVSKEHEERLADDNVKYHFHKNIIKITFRENAKIEEGSGEAELTVLTSNGETKKIPLLWDFQKTNTTNASSL
jgi:hypothetical protein